MVQIKDESRWLWSITSDNDGLVYISLSLGPQTHPEKKENNFEVIGEQAKAGRNWRGCDP